MSEISDRINLVCKLKNWSLRELAGKLGVTSTAIYNLMKGVTKTPSANVLMAFERIGLNSNWILTGEGSMEKNVEIKGTVTVDYLLEELAKKDKALQQKDNLIQTLQHVIDSYILPLGKWLDVSCSRFVFFVLLKNKFRYISVMF